MHALFNYPVLLLLATFALLWLAALVGAKLQGRRRRPFDEARKGDFDIVLGATLTLLSLIVGFTFSMASSRYDQRKNYEEDEANAIGTAYARAELLRSDDAAKVQKLLREYAELRVRFYVTSDTQQLADLKRATVQKQDELWKSTVAGASNPPTVLTGLATAAMNDAINSEGFAQAAAWNRIPLAAWVLMYLLGVIASLMLGLRFRTDAKEYGLVLIMPGIVATAFFLIADIDCPGRGTIRVLPQNLISLVTSLN